MPAGGGDGGAARRRWNSSKNTTRSARLPCPPTPPPLRGRLACAAGGRPGGTVASVGVYEGGAGSGGEDHRRQGTSGSVDERHPGDEGGGKGGAGCNKARHCSGIGRATRPDTRRDPPIRPHNWIPLHRAPAALGLPRVAEQQPGSRSAEREQREEREGERGERGEPALGELLQVALLLP